MEILLAAALASVADPLALVGYLTAGIFIHTYWWAVVAGISWRLLLHVVLVVPQTIRDQRTISEATLAAALIGAFLATSVIFFVAKKVREQRRTVTGSQQQSELYRPPTSKKGEPTVSDETVYTLFAAARRARNEGRLSEACKLYTRVIDEYPDQPESGVSRQEVVALKEAELGSQGDPRLNKQASTRIMDSQSAPPHEVSRSLNHELLTKRLQTTLDAVDKVVQTDVEQLALLFHEPEKAHPSVGLFLEALRAEPLLAIFDGRMQVLPSIATRVEISYLAIWLMQKGAKAGPAEAVADLQRYVEAAEIPFRLTIGLCGLKVAQRCELGEGITLIPWDDLPSTPHKSSVDSKFILSLGPRFASAAMVQEKILPKLHVSDSATEDLAQLDDRDIRDAILCISVVGPFALEELVSWLAPSHHRSA